MDLQHAATFQPITQLMRDVLIGPVHVGKACVAAPCGQLHGEEQGAAMGLGIIARVMVEPHFAIAKGAQRLPVGQDDVRHQHERRVEIASGGFAWRAPANRHLAEDLGGEQLAGLVEVLIAHDKDNVVVEGLLDGCAARLIDRL